MHDGCMVGCMVGAWYVHGGVHGGMHCGFLIISKTSGMTNIFSHSIVCQNKLAKISAIKMIYLY